MEPIKMKHKGGFVVFAKSDKLYKSLKHTLLVPLIFLLVGCIGDNADERLDAGYSDGYAVGYNTECNIRATLIEGDFDNADYSRGYYSGLADGAAACRRDK